MRTIEETAERNPPNARQYALCRRVGYWALVFEGREAIRIVRSKTGQAPSDYRRTHRGNGNGVSHASSPS
jgi:hypothetical protein